MERLTTDNPQTNMEILANFAYAKDKEVHLLYGDGLENVTLSDYIVDHAKSDFECSTNREDVINGDSCWECDCPLAVLNAVATQAAELRSKLKKYEDAEEQGRLIVLPCKMGAVVYRVIEKCRPSMNDCPFDGGYGLSRCNKNGEQYKHCGAYIEEAEFALSMLGSIGKTVFLSREEAEKALEGMK